MSEWKEVRRQLFHIIGGCICVFLLWNGFINSLIISIAIILGFCLSLYLRKNKLPFFSWMLKNFDRDEVLPGKGVITYALGILINYFIFNDLLGAKAIACAGIMVLAFGDGFATLIGKYFGVIKTPLHPKKVLEGTLAGISFGFLGALIFMPWFPAFFGSVVAMGMEGIQLKNFKRFLDDNLWIPLVASFVMLILH